eukprot:g31592.t1
MLTGLEYISYKEKLDKLRLLLLEHQRLRGDLIEVYKIMRGLDRVNSWSLSPRVEMSNTRVSFKCTRCPLIVLYVSILPKDCSGSGKQLTTTFSRAKLSLITLHWFLTAFASVVHINILLRVWDLFFCEGSVLLFQITLGMLKLK